MNDSDPNWPRFWPDVPETDRQPLREILAELLGRGTLLGSEGGGRDLFLLARDHYRGHLSDYLAPLGLELVIDEDFLLLQARPRPETCMLLGQFTKDETLMLLVMWRAWDDHRTTQAAQSVVITVDDLWNRFRTTFENMLAQRTTLGLLSEDIAPKTGEPWGNFPQTYSLVGLIQSAMRLSRRWEDAM